MMSQVYLFSVHGNIVDCTASIRGMFTDSCLICVHKLIGICSLYVAFEGDINFLACTWQ